MKRFVLFGLTLILCGCLPALTVESSRNYLGSGEQFAICAESSGEISITLNDEPVIGEPFDQGRCVWVNAPIAAQENALFEYKVSAANSDGITTQFVTIHVDVPIETALADVEDVKASVAPAEARYVNEVTSIFVEQDVAPSSGPEPDLSFLKSFENISHLTFSWVNVKSLDSLLLPPQGGKFLPHARLNSFYMSRTQSLEDISALSSRMLRSVTLDGLPITSLPPLEFVFNDNQSVGFALRNMSFPNWNFINQITLQDLNSGNNLNKIANVSVRALDIDDWKSINAIEPETMSLRASNVERLELKFEDRSYQPTIPCVIVPQIEVLFDSAMIINGCDERDPEEMTSAQIPAPDPAFKACLEQQDIRVSEMTWLDCQTANIQSLSGIEYLPNLNWFGIEADNSLVNLDELSALDKLEVLALHGTSTELVDIGALLDLPSLIEVVISESPKVNCDQADALVQKLGPYVADVISCNDD